MPDPVAVRRSLATVDFMEAAKYVNELQARGIAIPTSISSRGDLVVEA